MIAEHAVPPRDALWLASNPTLGEPVAFVVVERAGRIQAQVCHDDLGGMHARRCMGARARVLSPAQWVAFKRRLAS